MKVPAMSWDRKLLWWIYTILGVISLFFIVPSLLSAPDTSLVISGVVILIVYTVWSWHLWIRRVFEFVATKVEEEHEK